MSQSTPPGSGPEGATTPAATQHPQDDKAQISLEQLRNMTQFKKIAGKRTEYSTRTFLAFWGCTELLHRILRKSCFWHLFGRGIAAYGDITYKVG